MGYKSCLKNSPTATPPRSRPSSPTPPAPHPPAPGLARKCVSFGAGGGPSCVWDADEWDRTPADVAGKLSYRDMLELKAIQNSLPRAEQLARDPDCPEGRQRIQVLRKVPLGLLPLLPDSGTATPNPSPAISPPSSARTSRSPSPLRASSPPRTTAPARPSAHHPNSWRTWTPPPPVYPPRKTAPPAPSPLSNSNPTIHRGPPPRTTVPPPTRPRPKFSFLALLPDAGDAGGPEDNPLAPEPGEIAFYPSDDEPGEIIFRPSRSPSPKAPRTDEAVDVPDFAALNAATSAVSSGAGTPTAPPAAPYDALPTPPPAVDAPRAAFGYFALHPPVAGPSPAGDAVPTPTASRGPTPPSSCAPSTPGTPEPAPSPRGKAGMHIPLPLPVHMRLRALPSPALAPPSPFALDYAPGTSEGASSDAGDHSCDSGWQTEADSEPESAGVDTDAEEPVRRRGGAKGEEEVGEEDDEAEWETEMQLVELESGEMTVTAVRVRRR